MTHTAVGLFNLTVVLLVQPLNGANELIVKTMACVQAFGALIFVEHMQ